MCVWGRYGVMFMCARVYGVALCRNTVRNVAVGLRLVGHPWYRPFCINIFIKKVVARLTENDGIITPLLRGAPRLGLALYSASQDHRRTRRGVGRAAAPLFNTVENFTTNSAVFQVKCEKKLNTVYSAIKGNYRKVSCLGEHNTQKTSPLELTGKATTEFAGNGTSRVLYSIKDVTAALKL